MTYAKFGLGCFLERRKLIITSVLLYFIDISPLEKSLVLHLVKINLNFHCPWYFEPSVDETGPVNL